MTQEASMKCGQLTAQGFVLCVVFGSVVSSVWASPGDQDLIRERQNRLLEEQQRRLEELRSLPGKAAQPAPSQRPEDVRCFDISTIELKGADSLLASDRQALLKPFIGQCLGVSQLNALLKAITDQYLARGLVTSRAYLPQQDLSSGHLQVVVVEGRLESFRPDDSSGLSERELAMAFPVRRASCSICERSSRWSTSSIVCRRTRRRWSSPQARRSVVVVCWYVMHRKSLGVPRCRATMKASAARASSKSMWGLNGTARLAWPTNWCYVGP